MKLGPLTYKKGMNSLPNQCRTRHNPVTHMSSAMKDLEKHAATAAISHTDTNAHGLLQLAVHREQDITRASCSPS